MSAIYKTTWWGNICDSSSGYGSIYRAISNCTIIDAYIERVEADGGTIEDIQSTK